MYMSVQEAIKSIIINNLDEIDFTPIKKYLDLEKDKKAR